MTQPNDPPDFPPACDCDADPNEYHADWCAGIGTPLESITVGSCVQFVSNYTGEPVTAVVKWVDGNLCGGDEYLTRDHGRAARGWNRLRSSLTVVRPDVVQRLDDETRDQPTITERLVDAAKANANKIGPAVHDETNGPDDDDHDCDCGLNGSADCHHPEEDREPNVAQDGDMCRCTGWDIDCDHDSPDDEESIIELTSDAAARKRDRAGRELFPNGMPYATEPPNDDDQGTLAFDGTPAGRVTHMSLHRASPKTKPLETLTFIDAPDEPIKAGDGYILITDGTYDAEGNLIFKPGTKIRTVPAHVTPDGDGNVIITGITDKGREAIRTGKPGPAHCAECGHGADLHTTDYGWCTAEECICQLTVAQVEKRQAEDLDKINAGPSPAGCLFSWHMSSPGRYSPQCRRHNWTGPLRNSVADAKIAFENLHANETLARWSGTDDQEGSIESSGHCGYPHPPYGTAPECHLEPGHDGDHQPMAWPPDPVATVGQTLAAAKVELDKIEKQAKAAADDPDARRGLGPLGEVITRAETGGLGPQAKKIMEDIKGSMIDPTTARLALGGVIPGIRGDHVRPDPEPYVAQLRKIDDRLAELDRKITEQLADNHASMRRAVRHHAGLITEQLGAKIEAVSDKIDRFLTFVEPWHVSSPGPTPEPEPKIGYKCWDCGYVFRTEGPHQYGGNGLTSCAARGFHQVPYRTTNSADLARALDQPTTVYRCSSCDQLLSRPKPHQSPDTFRPCPAVSYRQENRS